jgi:hypothetical protein
VDISLAALAQAGAADWQRLCRVFHLHAIADEACAGLGLGSGDTAILYEFEANRMLFDAGTASRLPADRVRVLPKMRTPQTGMSLRSLSHNAALSRCEVDVRWRRFEYPTPTERQDRLRMLLFPWPFTVEASAFVDVEGPLRNLDVDKFGFFDFRPAYARADLLGSFRRAVQGSRDHTGPADAAVLPECAVTREEFDALWEVCREEGVKVLLAGVRGPDSNEARLRIGDGDEKLFVQHKHHRWCLDETQIRTYDIGSSLSPARRWWESTKLQPRALTFVAFNAWLTMCHLICEDLARFDPVAQVVRGVGPTLIVALLLDGPQIPKRWSARYSSVLAEDPGTSVLTFTSIGMAVRSRRSPTDPPNRTVAFWRDAKDGEREIPLEEGALGVLLTLWPNWVEEFTADGRPDGAVAGRVIFGGYSQIR